MVVDSGCVVINRSREGGIQQESEWLLIAGVLC